MDVFQLLLQLSDTMLELNSQINSTTNSNQIFVLNNLFTQSSFNLAAELEEELSKRDILLNGTLESEEISISSKLMGNKINSSKPGIYLSDNNTNSNNHRTNLLEDFVQRTLQSTSHSSGNILTTSGVHHHHHHQSNQVSNGKNSISNIINTLNNNQNSANKTENLLKKLTSNSLASPASSSLSTPSQSFRINSALNQTNNNKKSLSFHGNYQQKTASLSTEFTADHNFIENLYDKTSCTQFVDNLLNNNTKSIKSSLLNGEASRMSMCFSSSTDCDESTSSNHNESIYQCIDEDYETISAIKSGIRSPVCKKISTTTPTTSQILARQQTMLKQSSLLNTSSITGNGNGKQATLKLSTCSSSSSSSSSGCGGSSSLSSSSNADLASLPSSSSSSTNIVTDETNSSPKQENSVNIAPFFLPTNQKL